MPTDPGAILREARARHQIKQSELARRVKTTQSVISDYERGERSPTVEYLSEMLEEMGEVLVLSTRPKQSDSQATGNILYDPLPPLED